MCLQLDVPSNNVAPAIHEACTLPLVLGGLGLRNAIRTRGPAFRGNWADALST